MQGGTALLFGKEDAYAEKRDLGKLTMLSTVFYKMYCLKYFCS
jgi:hypothetical protein